MCSSSRRLTAEPSRKSRGKSWQKKKDLTDWDEERKLSALLRLVGDLEALLLSGGPQGIDHEQRVRGSIAACRRETIDLDVCSVQDQQDIVQSILAELRVCVADTACEWLEQQSS